jgi:hypothetical protein
MFEASVFVAGKFRSTNEMLSDLRAAGHYEGRARERGLRPALGHDLFVAQVEAIRLASIAAWRRWKNSEERIAVSGLSSRGQVVLRKSCVRVAFHVTGFGKRDPDSWYLLAKPAVDGMCVALGWSDRFNVWEVAGRVSRGKGEMYRDTVDDDRAGFWMQVTEVRP